MATKYSEIIKLRSMRPAYNIQQEALGDWETFITNALFNDLLKKAISAVRNNDSTTHKPIWIVGTYGTGKSHAGAVLKHLLCDEYDNITKYVESEYREEQFDLLRNSLLTLRKEKRLFPINLYGLENIVHEADLSLQVQSAIKKALKVAGINITVKTDFDSYLDHIETDTEFWERLIQRNVALQSIAPNLSKLQSSLLNSDTAVYDQIVNALRDGGFGIRMQSTKLQQWIFEVQNELRKGGVYDGLLIIWDEFTDVMTSAIGLKLLVQLQEIAETMMNQENDSYFLFISHPSALNSMKDEEREKTKGRYHYVTYNMEPVSAFKIMTKKFEILNYYLYEQRQDKYYKMRDHILDRFAQGNKETRRNLKNLFPLHPATANLATYFAREAGSSSRSVFDFLACDRVCQFFEDETVYSNQMVITADYLWDYVRDYFESDTARFGAVTERYNTHHLDVENQGDAYVAIFKGVLLLNALNNIANTDTVTPSEDNIRSLFEGTWFESSVSDVLDYFNENSIIQRQPNGNYSILFTALPSNEIQEERNRLRQTEFLYTSQVVNMGNAAEVLVNKSWLHLCARPIVCKFYSSLSNEYTLLNQIENEKKRTPDYSILLVFLVARDKIEHDLLYKIAENASGTDRFKNICFIVVETVFENKNYDRFIDFMANAACAQKHALHNQQQTYKTNALELLADWLIRMRNGNMCFMLNGANLGLTPGIRIASIINSLIAPTIFCKGPEFLDIIRVKSTTTYWKKASVKSTVDAVLSYATKTEVLEKCGGPAKHVEYLLQDSVDENLEWKLDVDSKHPLKVVCDFVDEMLSSKHTPRNQSFNLGDKLIDLTKAPFGLYQTYAPMAMVAFAMRKYENKLFDTTGKQKTAQHLVDDVVEMFKAWENGKTSTKLICMFEGKESRAMCDALIKILNLRALKGYSEISSLTDARWAVQHVYSKQKGAPFWVLKYVDCKDELKNLIDDVFKVIHDIDSLKNTELLSRTAKGLDKMHFELGNLLVPNADSFRKGLVNYIKSFPLVAVEDSEIEEVIDYLKGHLEGEIGLWTEYDVQEAVKDWRLLKTTKNMPQAPRAAEGQTVVPSGVTSHPVVVYPMPEKMDRLRTKINELDADQMRKLLQKICNGGDSKILDQILRYVSEIQ